MDNTWSEAFAKAISGDFTHPDPATLLDDIDAVTAGKTFPPLPNSIYQIAVHLVAWAEWGLAALKNEEFPRNEVEFQTNFFPDSPIPPDEKAWEEVKVALKKLSEEYIRILPGIDPAKLHPKAAEFPFLADFSNARSLIFVVSHTSYHSAQIVTLKRMAGIWKKGFVVAP